MAKSKKKKGKKGFADLPVIIQGMIVGGVILFLVIGLVSVMGGDGEGTRGVFTQFGWKSRQINIQDSTVGGSAGEALEEGLAEEMAPTPAE